MPRQDNKPTRPPKRPAAKSRAAAGTRPPTRKTAVRPAPPARARTLARLSKLIKRMPWPRITLAKSQPQVVSRPAGRATGRAAPPPVPSQSPGQPLSPPGGLSLDARLDIIGVILAFGGLLTLLSLLSANHGSATGGFLTLLGETFGWGTFLFPLTLVAIGLWLILRRFERVPQISIERLFGVLLIFFGALGLLHLFAFPVDRQASSELAAAAKGGGVTGALIYELLRDNLGVGGAAIALAAWMLIALTLSLDMAVVDLFHWLPPIVMKLQDSWDDFRTRNGAGRPKLPLPAAAPPAATGHAPPAEAGSPAMGTAAAHPAGAPATEMPHTWALPAVSEILNPGVDITYNDETDRLRARVIEETLASFGAPVNVVEINRGPVITQFGVEPDFVETRTGRMKVRVGKIATLADDLALALSARTIRVQAPVPGKGYVGIEVPNESVASVALREVIESEAFKRLKSPLRFAVGQDVAGNAVAAALDAMPHLLIAGATGSGKSVCVNALISCLLLHNTPDDLRLIMVDPKRVELTGYNGIPHLLSPVVVEMERVVGALQWVLREMDARYHKLAQAGTRNITEYNAKLPPTAKKLPRLVVFIDELADLMMLAPDETERSLTRLAQLARATGIHLVIATQRPSVDVVTGVIKANFSARIAFAVASGTDSRVILDQPGAERLLGRGDMLFQAPDSPAPVRIQGANVTDPEIQRLVQYWLGFGGIIQTAPASAGGVVDALPSGIPLKQIPLWEETETEPGDPLLSEAIDLARRQGRASITMLQRRLRIGYTRSARLVETMQEKKIIASDPGPQGFEVLDYGPAAPPVDEQRD